MAGRVENAQDSCSVCGESLSTSMRHCPTCRTDAGAPNVRCCRTDANLKALHKRYAESLATAKAGGCLKEFAAFEAALKDKSGVVVCMPGSVARKLIEDPKTLYSSYDQLVGANARRPAAYNDDRHRRAVGAVLFGSFAEPIIYGALSLSKNGLPTYGTVYCRLRSVAIEKRTSFLETNSFKFVEDHGVGAADKLPAGYSACWKERHSLVLAKLGGRISSGQGESDWQAILINSDEKKRGNDEFVEAHIYEGFDINAIEFMVHAPSRKLSRMESLDRDLALDGFTRLRGKTK